MVSQIVLVGSLFHYYKCQQYLCLFCIVFKCLKNSNNRLSVCLSELMFILNFKNVVLSHSVLERKTIRPGLRAEGQPNVPGCIIYVTVLHNYGMYGCMNIGGHYMLQCAS